MLDSRKDQVIEDANSLSGFWHWCIAAMTILLSLVVSDPVGTLREWPIALLFSVVLGLPCVLVSLFVSGVLPRPYAWLQRKLSDLACHLPA